MHIAVVFCPSLSLPFEAYIMASQMLALASSCTKFSSSLWSHGTVDTAQVYIFAFFNMLFVHVETSFMHPRDFSPISPPQMLPSTVAYTLSISFHPVRVLDFFVFVLDTLNVEAKALLVLGKHSATELDHQPMSG